MSSGTPPVPDPTVLTTEQLLREVAGAVDLLEAKLQGLDDVMLEKFASVGTQFKLIENQRIEQKQDTEKAVQAALNAAKEAVKEQTAASEKSITKSETATAEQLRQLTETFKTAIGGVTDTLTDLKERVGKIESRKEGANELHSAQDVTWNKVVGLAVVGVAFLTIIVMIAIATHGFTK